MLLCSSKIPVSKSCTASVFVALAIEWVTSSRNYAFEPFNWDGSADFIETGKNGEVFQIGLFEEKTVCAIHFSAVDNRSIKWTTDFVLDNKNSFLAFQLYREAPVDIEHIERAFSLPLLVKKIIDAGYSDLDNGIKVMDKPILVNEEDVDWLANMMLHSTTYSLPVVYMSCETDGHCAANPYMMAEKLNGVAHVIYETTRNVSYILRNKTNGINPYAGAIEIFYPKGSRRFLPSRLSGSHSHKVYAVVNTVFEHLNQLRVEDRFSWSQLQANKLKKQLSATILKKEQDTKEYEFFEHTYEELLDEKESEIKKLGDQLNSANGIIARLETQLTAIENIPVLSVGEERDLYPFEQQAFLIEILEKECRSINPNSRKAHILSSILSANKCDNTVEEKRQRLKNCLRGYTKMTSSISKELEAIGFSLSDDGKHIKMVFGQDPRYTGTLSKTGSDHRAGDNTAHDLIRSIF